MKNMQEDIQLLVILIVTVDCQMVSSACESPEQVNALKVDILSAKVKNSELEEHVSSV